MKVSEIEAGRSFQPLIESQANPPQKANEKSSFVDTLNELVTDVNSQQLHSKEMTEAFVKGEPVDLHDVMIASQKAKTSFQLLMELRNKAMDLYQEVKRMQV